MGGRVNKTIWVRVALIAVLLPVCIVFPWLLAVVGFVLWTIYEDLQPPQYPHVAPPRTWRDARREDSDWLNLFCQGCESPAEVQFLKAMVAEFNLEPYQGKLISPSLTLEIQVVLSSYRFDFVVNGRFVIEVDGAAYHSSPEQIERDRIRDEYSIQKGFKVLRIPASVVFKTPGEALRRVKEMLAEPLELTAPAPTKAMAGMVGLTGYLAAFSEGVDAFSREITIASLRQSAAASYKSAISTEEIFLEALVGRVESDQKVALMSPQERRHYDEMWSKFGALRTDDIKGARIEACTWTEIIPPAPVNDPELQRQIEAEYVYAMEERSKRHMKLRDRCVKDLVFAQRLYRKMREASFPEAYAVYIIPAASRTID